MFPHEKDIFCITYYRLYVLLPNKLKHLYNERNCSNIEESQTEEKNSIYSTYIQNLCLYFHHERNLFYVHFLYWKVCDTRNSYVDHIWFLIKH